MKIKATLSFIFFIALISQPSFALKRGIGFGGGSVDSASSTPLSRIGNLNTFFDEVVYSDGVFGITHEIRYQWANDIAGNFNNVPTNDFDLRLFSGTLGFRISDQEGFFQPYVGAGIVLSAVNLQEPGSSSVPFFEKETKFGRGWFAEGGVDFLFNDQHGLRLGVKYNDLETDRFRSISSDLDFDYFTFYGAFVITFRGCNPWWFLNEFGIGPTQGC